MIRLLVTGSRDWSDYLIVLRELTLLHQAEGVEVVIHGNCRGADKLAGRAAKELRIPVLVFPAKWDEHGKAAGPIRNQQMLDEGYPDYVLALHDHFEESKGTKDMVERTQHAGLPARLVWHGGSRDV